MLGNINFLVLVAQVSRVGRRGGCDGQGDEKKDERGAHCRFIKKLNNKNNKKKQTGR
jgi:hypothetical protein